MLGQINFNLNKLAKLKKSVIPYLTHKLSIYKGGGKLG